MTDPGGSAHAKVRMENMLDTCIFPVLIKKKKLLLLLLGLHKTVMLLISKDDAIKSVVAAKAAYNDLNRAQTSPYRAKGMRIARVILAVGGTPKSYSEIHPWVTRRIDNRLLN